MSTGMGGSLSVAARTGKPEPAARARGPLAILDRHGEPSAPDPARPRGGP